MSKNPGQGKVYKKYVYRTHESSVTHRSNSQQNGEGMTARKQSKPKFKKEATENSFGLGSQLVEDYRLPLGEFRDNGLRPHQNLAHLQKMEMKALRTKNEALERQLGEQSREIEQLRVALSAIKESVEGVRKLKEGEALKETNLSLQMQFQSQTRELEALTMEIQQLKESMGSSVVIPSMSTSEVKESKVSRRAEYAHNYEVFAESIPKECQECARHRAEKEEMRRRYEDELRRVQEKRGQMREKEATLFSLEEEIRNKNECVDYLRAEIEKFESHSKNLVSIISSLEGMLEKDTRRRRPSQNHSKSISNDMENHLVTFRY